MTKKIQAKLRGQIEEIIGKKDNSSPVNLLALHLEEIYEETQNIFLLIEKIANKKVSTKELHHILIGIKTKGGHLKDHLVEMKKPNEKVLVELDKVISQKSK